MRVSHEVELGQRDVLRARRETRDEALVQRTLSELVDVAQGEGNTVPPMLAAARAEATLGEICTALKGIWGEYRETARF